MRPVIPCESLTLPMSVSKNRSMEESLIAARGGVQTILRLLRLDGTLTRGWIEPLPSCVISMVSKTVSCEHVGSRCLRSRKVADTHHTSFCKEVLGIVNASSSLRSQRRILTIALAKKAAYPIGSITHLIKLIHRCLHRMILISALVYHPSSLCSWERNVQRSSIISPKAEAWVTYQFLRHSALN
jgi:hypothetical protein